MHLRPLSILATVVCGAIAVMPARVVGVQSSSASTYAQRGAEKYQKKDLDGAIADSLHALTIDERLLLPNQTLAHAFLDKAKDATASDAQKRDFVARGTDAVDAALAIQSDDLDMSEYRSLFLRLEASLEPDSKKRQFLTEKGDAWDRVLKSLRVLKARPAPVNAPPKQLVHVEPVYPPIAIQARISGVVELALMIDERGHVTDVTVTKSIPLLDAAAVAAARQWVYEPPMVNGKAAAIRLPVTVTFTLK